MYTNFGSLNFSDKYLNDAIVGLTPDQIAETPSAKAGPNMAKELRLRSILERCNKGKAVLGYYNTNKRLEKSVRDKLVEVILEYYLEGDVNCRYLTK